MSAKPERAKPTHAELCEAAVTWLNGRCNVALSGIASTVEIPDAIGWSTLSPWRGSIVIEVKVSRSDFYANKGKYERWIPPELNSLPPAERYNFRTSRMTAAQKRAAGWTKELCPAMGNYRIFLVPRDMVTAEEVQAEYPQYGLAYKTPRGARLVQMPERFETINHAGEIRLLQFALVHVKDNLLSHGCSVDLSTLTKHWLSGGGTGLTFPKLHSKGGSDDGHK